jgi:ABC-type uncharacterized transport system substrate-binding protein
VRRREIISLLAGAMAMRPLGGLAQQPVRRVGVLIAFRESDPLARAMVTAFAQALRRFGWVEGSNIRLDYRFAAGDPALFSTYAAELVALSPDAILETTPPAVAALRQRTQTIPIVFIFILDPVALGLVQSLARPGGNITGFGVVEAPIMGKWLQLLKEVAPAITRVAVIFNPETTLSTPLKAAIEAAAASFGVTVTPAPVHDDAGIEAAIAAQARQPGGSLIALPDSFTVTHRDAIVAAATRHRLPLVGVGEAFPKAGALLSYFYDPVEMFAEAASYIDRILKGANPGELPVQQPTKFSLVINLKTAKALGLTIPPALLDTADEIIE